MYCSVHAMLVLMRSLLPYMNNQISISVHGERHSVFAFTAHNNCVPIGKAKCSSWFIKPQTVKQINYIFYFSHLWNKTHEYRQHPGWMLAKILLYPDNKIIWLLYSNSLQQPVWTDSYHVVHTVWNCPNCLVTNIKEENAFKSKPIGLHFPPRYSPTSTVRMVNPCFH
jgi:hypothetical protein